MKCEQVREEYEDRCLDKELTVNELKELKSHLENCDHCQQSFSKYKEFVQLQKSRYHYTPSLHGKQKLMRKIWQKKLLPYELMSSVAVAFLCFFGIQSFINSRITNQRFEMILNKSIYSISASAEASYTKINPKLVFQNPEKPQFLDPDRILNLLNDGD